MGLQLHTRAHLKVETKVACKFLGSTVSYLGTPPVKLFVSN